MEENIFALQNNNLSSSKFPLTIKYAENTGVYRVSITPLSVLEICDIVQKEVSGKLLVFDVDQCYWFDEDNNSLLSLKQISDKKNLKAYYFDSDNICIDSNKLQQLMDDFDYYNFKLIQYDVIPKEINYITLIDKVRKASKSDEIVLNNNIDSALYLCSHDDCFTYVESKNKNLILSIVYRLLHNLIITSELFNKNEIIRIDCDSISQIIIHNEFITILQKNFRIENNQLWPIFDQEYPWRSNGDLTKYSQFKIPWKYLKAEKRGGFINVGVCDSI